MQTMERLVRAIAFVCLAAAGCSGEAPDGGARGKADMLDVAACDVPGYAAGTAYRSGDRVLVDGQVYACKPWPFSGWCGVGGPYAPGTGWAWQDAWELVGSCEDPGDDASDDAADDSSDDSADDSSDDSADDSSDDSADDSSDDSADDSGDGIVDDGDDGTDPGDPGNDFLAPSQNPPGGLRPNQVPQFVSLGWDDNAYSGLEGSAGTGGMDWAVKMIAARRNPAGSGNANNYDGQPISMSFYMTSTYSAGWFSESNTYVRRAWRAAYTGNNEIGNHTHSHSHGAAFSAGQWQSEIQTCNNELAKPFDPNEVGHSPDPGKGMGMDPSKIFGFRTPFLEYNDATFSTVKNLGFWYDCSIEEGFEYDQDGTNFFWPYTLDQGSPGHDVQVEWGSKQPISRHPGLWELPVYAVIVPPDDQAARYGIAPGLRNRLKAIQSWFDTESGKITGFDYNLWVSFRMTKEEVLATLKYSLDQRLRGNRAPFLIGTHTDYYSSKYTAAPSATPRQRQEAIEEFIDYALSKPEVRVVSQKKVLDWMRRQSQ
jgi:peptidoglycan/xylan/chitin deacetylase (PgdA/CDA1 family)